jgi:hypothetical protein
MIRRVYPWILFLVCAAFLAFSASPFARSVDNWILWPLRLGVIFGLSLIVLWSRWRHRNGSSHDSADSFLTSLRRWYYGDSN